MSLGPKATHGDRNTLICQISGEQEFSVGSLRLGGVEHFHTDLLFEAGLEITFSITGKDPVSLLGYYIDQDSEDYDGSDLDEDEIDNHLAKHMNFSEMDDEESDDFDQGESDEDEDLEIDQSAVIGSKRKAIENGAKKAEAVKKLKQDPAAKTTTKSTQDVPATEVASDTPTTGLSKSAKKRLKKQEAKKAEATGTPEPKEKAADAK